jgi:hypothetical protein
MITGLIEPKEFVALVQSRIMEVVTAAVDDEDQQQQYEKAAYSIMA